MAEEKKSIYETLSKIDVKPYLKTISGKKIQLKYLSWANALSLVKSYYPDTSYEIREYPNWVKTKDGSIKEAGTLDYRITSAGCEVEVTAIIKGQKFTQKLYPMDNRNQPIMNPNIKDINKAQMRCLVKALATAGLGLEVYAGEDLPTSSDEIQTKPSQSLGEYSVSFSENGKTYRTNLENLYNSTQQKDKDKAESAKKVVHNLQGQDRAKWLTYSAKRDAETA